MKLLRRAAPWGLFTLAALSALAPAWADPWPAVAIPAVNARDLRTAPARPPPGDAAQRARLLFEALRSGSDADVTAAEGFFLPRDPFLAIKDMRGAAGYFATLVRAYRRDIATLRAERPELSRAEFRRFVPARSCTWMAVGREANRLPYWSCYRSRIEYSVGARAASLEVRVMIHWGDRWYVTHLLPFAHPAAR